MMDCTEAETRLAKCVEMLEEQFRGEFHFAVFVMRRPIDGEPDSDVIEGTYMSTLPNPELRSCVVGMIDGTDPDDIEQIQGSSIN